MPEIEDHTQLELPPASLVTASLSPVMLDSLPVLQHVYAEEFGADHLVLPDDLYATFAKVVVPSPEETKSDITGRVEQSRQRALVAMGQVVVNIDGPFNIPLQYDDIITKRNWFELRESKVGQSQALHNLFSAVLGVPSDGGVAVRLGMFKDGVDLSRAQGFSRANVRPHLRIASMDSPITNLQLREISPKTGRLEIVEEIPLPKN